MDQATCKTCGTPILWVRTAYGYKMPLDAEPVANGNITLDTDGIAQVVKKGSTPPEGTKTYVSHFATCVHADQHRKK
jgi:hypothetical protein